MAETFLYIYIHIYIYTYNHRYGYIYTQIINIFTYNIWLPLLTYKDMTQQNPMKTTLYYRSGYVPRNATVNLDLLLIVYDTGLHSIPNTSIIKEVPLDFIKETILWLFIVKRWEGWWAMSVQSNWFHFWVCLLVC